MKLLCCIKCNEIFNLSLHYAECKGGHCGGLYVDNLVAQYWGPKETTFVLGFANSSFVGAVRDQLNKGDLPPRAMPGYGVTSPGREFTAFVIPNSSPSVIHSTKELTAKKRVQ